MSSPSATAIFVGGASLLHLRPKFSVTGTIYVQDFLFGNLATDMCYGNVHNLVIT